jgi:hypothetical protein
LLSLPHQHGYSSHHSHCRKRKVILKVDLTAVRSAATCYEPLQTGELYLSCRSYGVISIMSAWRGASLQNVTSSTCDSRSTQLPLAGSGRCVEEDTDIGNILDACMGMPVCYPSVMSRQLTSCNVLSRYSQIDYRCISTGKFQLKMRIKTCH